MLSDIFHNDDCAFGDPTNLFDQALEHCGVGDVLHTVTARLRSTEPSSNGRCEPSIFASLTPGNEDKFCEAIVPLPRDVAPSRRRGLWLLAICRKLPPGPKPTSSDRFGLKADGVEECSQKLQSFVPTVRIVIAGDDVLGAPFLNLLPDLRSIDFRMIFYYSPPFRPSPLTLTGNGRMHNLGGSGGPKRPIRLRGCRTSRLCHQTNRVSLSRAIADPREPTMWRLHI